MKQSEARILTYLKSADTVHKFARQIATKLNMDYNYILRVILGMVNKEWITSVRRSNKIFYHLTEDAPIEEASSLLSEDKELKP